VKGLVHFRPLRPIEGGRLCEAIRVASDHGRELLAYVLADLT